ncbi:MAG: preprotein translocase subunit SecY [Candidatus Pacearchaeota archaeon]
MDLKGILKNLPEVKKPNKKLDFNTKLKWTLIILILFFFLANIPLYGLADVALSRFEYLAILLGTEFGSIISLGIGPIVMASIILQLLVGVQIIKIDTKKEEGKKFYQGLNKLLVFFFIIFEAVVYVLMKGLEAKPGLEGILILQLCIGGLLIVFMDEITQKWGFGSGVSLFIAAGIGWRLFARLFQFIDVSGAIKPVGEFLVFFSSLINGDGTTAFLSLITIVITVILFIIVVWAQSLKVEIPLAFDRLRGYGIKWPLPLFYAGVIPVILVSALVGNIQLFGSLLENYLGRPTFLGGFSEGGVPYSGLAFWIHTTPILELIIKNSLTWKYVLQGFFHLIFYVVFSIIFSYFWVMTANLDAQSQAKNILNSGLNIPGFRKDERVLETILKRYVGPLTILGGAAIGFLAALADLTGALVGGTSILLVVMIIYQFYQNIAQQHALDMNPALAGFFKGG